MAALLTFGCACATPAGLASSLGLRRPSSISGRASAAAVSKIRLPRSPAVAAAGQLKKHSLGNVSAALSFIGSSITENRVRSSQLNILKLDSFRGGAMGSMCNLPASVETLRWVLVAAATALLFMKNVSIPKQYLVPLLALEFPREIFSWSRGEYGLWTAFVALLVQLFYHIPGELKLPLYALLLVIVAPAQITQYRGSTPAALASLVIGLYLGIEHYRSLGSVNDAFKSEKLLGTIAVLALVIVPTLFFFNNVYV